MCTRFFTVLGDTRSEGQTRPRSSMSAVHTRTAHWVPLGGVSADQRRCVVRGGVEPPTFRFSGGRSYRLSYLTLARCSA